jgi:hypothetical protein
MKRWFDLLVECRYPADKTFHLGQHRGTVGWDHPDVRAHFESKHRIAAALQPRRIIEIGVRCGYSAWAMLSAVPRASYLGIDNRDPAYGDGAAFAAHAAGLLEGFAGARFLNANSRELVDLPPPVADLVHVDGDHSFEGAQHDIELALRSGARWVLIDDTDYLDLVRSAATSAARGRLAFDLREPLRGAVLIWNGSEG